VSIAPATVTESVEPPQRASRGAVAVFAATTFVGSGLLFLVQPMVAKLLLPGLGGSPSVWNTCVVFFQATLLFGYAYAHFSTRWLGTRRQIPVHLCLLLAPLAFLPLAVGSGEPPASTSPERWLLGTLTVRIGLPFFVVSATAPLMQRWFATLPIAPARDPYFLYAASNLGSMVALVAFPLLLEPMVGVRHLTWLWTAGYVVLAIATAACWVILRSFPDRAREDSARGEPRDRQQSLAASTRWRWVLLSFVPSSLMLGVTTHISTDVAAVPLLWIVPLALYLGSFVLAFGTSQVLPGGWLARILPALVSVCLFSIVANSRHWLLMPLHMGTFFVCAIVWHRELARRRPDARHLTEFYIWMSVGGMIGGVFNTLVAPHVFTSVLEYPIVLALAAQIPTSSERRILRARRWSAFVWPGLAGLLFYVGLRSGGALSASGGPAEALLGVILFAAIAYLFVNRPEPFAIVALLLVSVITFGRPLRGGTVLFAGRSFFGVHRVVDAADHSYHLLQHGSTNHGRQETATAGGCEPTGYYHRDGPIGQVFAAAGRGFEDVAVVGLGSGALACYAAPGQRWTFYEIDPIVERIAREPRYFTYLQNSAGHVNVILGDGRLNLRRATRAAYDLIVLDAFSSDGIPIHLLTREAVGLYQSRLRPAGMIAIHISNRYLNLEPVLAAIARDDGLSALGRFDGDIADADAKRGRWPSVWVALGHTGSPIDSLTGLGWHELSATKRGFAWTDDYSNLVHVLRLQ
jgi:hypothetical protein